MTRSNTGMPEHIRASKCLLGEFSLGKTIQQELDAHSQQYPGVHRLVDHSAPRLIEIAQKYGEFGMIEVAIHIALDYDWFPDWRKLKGKTRKNKRVAKK